MDIHHLPYVFHGLAAAILSLWAVASSIESGGTRGMLLTGLAMLALGFGLPLASH